MTKPTIRTTFTAAFALTVIVLLINGVGSITNTYRLRDNNRRVLQTDAILALLEKTISAFKDAETGQRGYLLTGTDSYLEPFQNAVTNVGEEIDRLKALTSNSPEQQERIVFLESKWGEKLAELNETIALRKNQGVEAAIQVVRTDRGKTFMDDIRRVVAAMEASERTMLNRRVAQSARSLDQAIVSIAIATTIAILLVTLFAIAVAYHLASRRNDELKLREQLERWQVTLASIGDAVVITDNEGRVTFLNASAQDLTEWDLGEAAGQPLEVVFPIVNEDTLERVEDPVTKVLREGRALGLANHSAVIARGGKVKPIDDSAAPIRDQRGNTLGVVLVAHEIPAAEKASRKLADSEARTQAILDTAVDAIITIDERGTVESLNPAAERLFSYAAAEVIGQNIKMLMPEPYHGEHDGYLKNYRETGLKKIIGIGREVVGRRKDGSTFPMHLAVSELRLGERRMFTGIARDISELKDAVRQLEDSEARSRAIFDFAVDALITIDERGNVESVNPAAERLFGYAAADLRGKNVKQLMPEPYRGEHDGYLASYRATGQKKVIGIGREVVGRRKDGTTFPMELAVSEVRLAGRRLFAGSVRDITDRKRADLQLRFYANEVQERNAELIRSNQELDDFAYIASHDLKEPLRGIHNYATFLIEDYGEKLDEPGRAKLDTLKDLTQRMYALIDSLLEFSRVGRVDLAVQETDLNDVLAEVLGSLRISLEERGFAVKIPRPLPTIPCDHVRIAEVYRNLITNAIKYNDKAEPWIEIGWRDGTDSHAGDGSSPRASTTRSPAVFTIRDNGIGIALKYFESIFRIFKRLHPRDKFGGGTGVGLTIVKKIIERHGGRIWVESTLGEGTTFAFTLNGERGHDGGSPSDPGDRRQSGGLRGNGEGAAESRAGQSDPALL
jgi:PAS domain S-box-containing protein